MAVVHFGRLQGPHFTRTVAIKELHPQFAGDPEFITMFLDEARITARIQHPNVVIPLDVVVLDHSGEVFLVMEYVHGETVSRLWRAARGLSESVPVEIVAAISTGVLHGLHAAHEAKDELGAPLNVVHRDFSPQNILVGVDGVARVLDFGIAKAVSRAQSTLEGNFKGKLAYMSPEQMRAGPVDRRADIFAAGVVIWEALAHRRLFAADDPAGTVSRVLEAPIVPPSDFNPAVSPALDRVVLKALDRDAARRFQTARELAAAVEEEIEIASPRRLGEWVARVGAKALDERAEILARIDSLRVEVEGVRPAAPVEPPQLEAPPATGAPLSGRPMPVLPWSPDSNASGTSQGHGELLEVRPAPNRWRRRGLVALSALALATLVIGVGLRQVGRTVDPSGGTAPPGIAPPVASAVQLAGPPPAAAGSAVPPRSSLPPTVVSIPGPLRAAETPEAPQPPLGAPNPSPEVATKGGERAAPERGTVPAPAPAPPSASGPRKTVKKVSAKVKTKAGPRTAAQASDVAASCVPPYTVDAAGIRRVKPQCL